MKALKYLRRTSALHIDHATIQGGFGDITIGDWKGSVVFGYNEHGWEHVSVSPYNGKTPTWDDMCAVKNIFWDDEEEVLQFHPKKSQYINLKDNCLHLWRPLDPETQRRLER